MNDKSYVTMESKVCAVCGKKYSTDSILLDMHLREKFDRETVTGWGLCEEHQQQHDRGFIHLVEIDPDKSEYTNGKIKIDAAYRTGGIVSVKSNVLDILGFPAEARTSPFIFIDHEMVELLTKLQEQTPNEESTGDHSDQPDSSSTPE